MAWARLHNAPQDDQDKWGYPNYSTNQHQLAGISTCAVAQPLAQLCDNLYGAGSKSYFTQFPPLFACLYLPLPAPLPPPPPPPKHPCTSTPTSHHNHHCHHYYHHTVQFTNAAPAYVPVLQGQHPPVQPPPPALPPPPCTTIQSKLQSL